MDTTASRRSTLVDSQFKFHIIQDDGTALCLCDDTMKIWYMGYEGLKNFREDVWVDDNGSIPPVSSPFMLAGSLDEEVKRLEAQYINLPYDEDGGEAQLTHSPLSNLSDSATTPPLSPCSQFDSPESLPSSPFLPGSPIHSPFLLTLPLSLGVHQTISPYEIFSPLPPVEEDLADGATMEKAQVPPTPVVPTRSLPEAPGECVEDTPLSLPNHSPFRSPPTPVAGPSSSPLKRSRWFEDESGDESDEFTPQARKNTRAGKRSKPGSLKRASSKFEGKGTECNLCGMYLGRVTDLPRHRASCKSNPERTMRKTRVKFVGSSFQSVRMRSNDTSHPRLVVPN